MDYIEMKKLMSQQVDQMAPDERLKAYFAGEEVDYLPYSLLAPELAYSNIFGYTAKEYFESFEVKREVIGKAIEKFGYNSFSAELGLRTMGIAYGSKICIPENGIDYINEYILEDYSNLDKMDVIDPYNNSVLYQILEETRKMKESYPDLTISTGVAGPFSTASALRPVEKILRDTRKDKDNLFRLLELSVDSSLKWIEVFKKEFGIISTGFCDPVTCTDILSYKQFMELSVPFIKRLVDGIKEITGSAPLCHICGGTKGLWNELADAGIISFSVDNCEDLEELKQKSGDRMVIIGNIPPVDIIKNGSIDDVIEHCKICIEKGSENPMGFMLNTGCQVPIGTPKENIEAFIYAARKYGKGARKGRLPKGLLED